MEAVRLVIPKLLSSTLTITIRFSPASELNNVGVGSTVYNLDDDYGSVNVLLSIVSPFKLSNANISGLP